jgi:hypothetical protein
MGFADGSGDGRYDARVSPSDFASNQAKDGVRTQSVGAKDAEKDGRGKSILRP